MTNLEFVNDADKQPHQINKSPHKSEVTQPDLLTGETRTPWTPHQTYDSKGNGNFHENSEGVVLTTPSGHPFCAYCRIPSHPRQTCPLREKHLSEQMDKLYHPSKGVVKSNNEKRRINNLSATEDEDTANHNIGGQTKIRASHVKDIHHDQSN